MYLLKHQFRRLLLDRQKHLGIKLALLGTLIASPDAAVLHLLSKSFSREYW